MSGETGSGVPFTASLDWCVLLFTMAATLAASLLFSLAPAAQFWNPRLAERCDSRDAAGRFAGFPTHLRSAADRLQPPADRRRRTVCRAPSGTCTMSIPGFATDHCLLSTSRSADGGVCAVSRDHCRASCYRRSSGPARCARRGCHQRRRSAGTTAKGDVVVDQDCNHPRPEENEFDIELPWVSNGYLQTLGVPLVAGRYFTAADTATSQKVAIVNETFVRHYFPNNAAALGHHVVPSAPAGYRRHHCGSGEGREAFLDARSGMATSYTLFTQAERPDGL